MPRAPASSCRYQVLAVAIARLVKGVHSKHMTYDRVDETRRISSYEVRSKVGLGWAWRARIEQYAGNMAWPSRDAQRHWRPCSDKHPRESSHSWRRQRRLRQALGRSRGCLTGTGRRLCDMLGSDSGRCVLNSELLHLGALTSAHVRRVVVGLTGCLAVIGRYCTESDQEKCDDAEGLHRAASVGHGRAAAVSEDVGACSGSAPGG